VCREKEEGGLGIKKLKAFNLTENGNGSVQKKIVLWVKVLSGKYGETNC